MAKLKAAMAPMTPRTMFAAGHQEMMAWTLASAILEEVVWAVVLLVKDGIDSDAELEGETLELVGIVELVGKYISMDVLRCDDC
jgi:hypothetical protein